MTITSPDFTQKIPSKYTCDGDNINPALTFTDTPQNTKSLALIMDDPDAPMGTFVHWVVFDINPTVQQVSENSVPNGGKQGLNGANEAKYMGPCPPSGEHRYFFKLYALDSQLNLTGNPHKEEVEEAMQGHIISQAELIGLYSRSK